MSPLDLFTPSPVRQTLAATPHVAIVGATGAVGAALLESLEQRGFPLASLRLLASPRSAGRSMWFRGAGLPVEALGEDSFAGIDLALFSAGSGVSKQYAPLAVQAGAVVVDNSSAFRMDPDVPLVVPEINAASIATASRHHRQPELRGHHRHRPLWPLHQAHRILRVMSPPTRPPPAPARSDGRTARLHRGPSRRRDLRPPRAAPPLRLQPVQPRHRHRPRHRL